MPNSLGNSEHGAKVLNPSSKAKPRSLTRHGNAALSNLPARRRCYALTLLLILWGSSQAVGEVSASLEYQVKAAFLFNFAKFVEWPAGSFENEKTPIVFCIFRDDPFGNALERVILGKPINDRNLIERRIKELPELKECQVVFVSDKEDKRLSGILDAVKSTATLVVGESDSFAERGGGIQFFLENNKLRFAVNVDAVQRARLNVSSKMLALARIVHDHGHPKGALK